MGGWKSVSTSGFRGRSGSGEREMVVGVERVDTVGHAGTPGDQGRLDKSETRNTRND